MRALAYSLRIRRPEFLVAEIPILGLPLLLTGRSLSWEYVVLFFLLFHFGDMINCLCDRDLDAVEKPQLSRAVYGLGVRNVCWQIALTTAAALGLAIHLSQLPLVAIGLVLGAAYSVPPLRLKGRGPWQIACLWTILFVGPMLLVGGPSVLALSACYGALQMGVILVNTAEDYPEDRAAGIRTSIVALGLHRGIRLARTLFFAGGAGVMVLFALQVRHFVALVPLLAACLFVGGSIARLSHTIDRQDLPTAVATVKRAGKRVPIFITLTAWAALAAALFV
jgi:1,4-dihydroxy-2-naphthoate octaprenyltransferase